MTGYNDTTLSAAGYISSSGKNLANQHSSHKDGDETTHTKIANPTSRCRFEAVEVQDV
jgi:hypothetical protein